MVQNATVRKNIQNGPKRTMSQNGSRNNIQNGSSMGPREKSIFVSMVCKNKSVAHISLQSKYLLPERTNISVSMGPREKIFVLVWAEYFSEGPQIGCRFLREKLSQNTQ